LSKNTPQVQFVHLYSLEGLMPFVQQSGSETEEGS